MAAKAERQEAKDAIAKVSSCIGLPERQQVTAGNKQHHWQCITINRDALLEQ